jgi:hypothetical protein
MGYTVGTGSIGVADLLIGEEQALKRLQEMHASMEQTLSFAEELLGRLTAGPSDDDASFALVAARAECRILVRTLRQVATRIERAAAIGWLNAPA